MFKTIKNASKHEIRDQLTLADDDGYSRFENLRGFGELPDTQRLVKHKNKIDYLCEDISESLKNDSLRLYALKIKIEQYKALENQKKSVECKRKAFIKGLIG
ncbi:MAG: hypothetical protein ACHQJ6_04565 [Candidatus Berkiellales bacterium]